MEKGHSNLYKNEPVCICKEDWWVGLGHGESCLCEGRGNCLKCLKMGGKKKRGRKTQILKMEGKLGQGGDALKRWVQNPRTNYALVCS